MSLPLPSLMYSDTTEERLARMHTQIKFCVSLESTYIFYFPADLEESVCFYWAGIIQRSRGEMLLASLGSYFVFVNGTPPGE